MFIVRSGSVDILINGLLSKQLEQTESLANGPCRWRCSPRDRARPILM